MRLSSYGFPCGHGHEDKRTAQYRVDHNWPPGGDVRGRLTEWMCSSPEYSGGNSYPEFQEKYESEYETDDKRTVQPG